MRMKDNKFFSFFEPVLKYIDTGKFFREPFRWLYAILAILNLLTPIVLLVMAINNDLFRYGGGRMIAAFILVWLVIAFVSWLGFQIWWNRREKVYAAATAHDDFVAIPVFSHFIQTFGEWAGMFVGIGGALLTLIAAIFLNGDASMLRMMGTGAFFGSGSLIYIVLNPIYGFIIVVVTRAAAETFVHWQLSPTTQKKADRALLRGRYFPPPAPFSTVATPNPTVAYS